jgi:hypothetical protein
MKHTLAWLDVNTGETKIDYRPVHTYTLTNEVEYIAPKARTYSANSRLNPWRWRALYWRWTAPI